MPDENRSHQIVVFTIGSEQYALPIAQVQEIIRYHEPRLVASPIPWVRGVISLRGRIVPVYDIAERLGIDSELTEHAKIVIVEAGTETAGVIVDDVDEVLTVDEQQFEHLPDTGSDMIDSVVKIEERLVVLVNVAAIFDYTPAAVTA
jgi:purine-binding chemotaxis protein CheW